MDFDRTDNDDDTDRRTKRRSLLFGVGFITVGLLLLIGELDLAPLEDLWRFWPLVLTAIGVAKLVPKPDAADLHAAAWLIGLSGWFLTVSFYVGGLSWSNSWPLVIILAGVIDIVFPEPAKDREIGLAERLSGLATVAIGFWCLANTLDWWGMRWSDSWPILLIIAGVGVIVKGIGVSIARSEKSVVVGVGTGPDPLAELNEEER